MTKSIVLYARVSSERQVHESTIDSQIAAVRERVAADGHTVLPSDEFVDNGHSGSTLRRPALERLRDRIAHGTVDILYLHAADRLARRHAHQVLLLEEFASQSVSVMMLEGHNGDSAEDQLLVQVQGVIAEYERAKIMERSRRGKLHKARIGSVNVLSGAPYGYLYVRKSVDAPARYNVALHEARIVRKIFESVVRDRMSLSAVARMLNEQKVPPRRGAKQGGEPSWRAGAIREVLLNPSYMGQAAFGKTERIEVVPPLRQFVGRAAVPKGFKSSSRNRPPEEWIRLAVPPLVSEEMFAAAQEQLERNKALVQRGKTKNRYLLAGLTMCAKCRYGYYGKKLTERYSYYQCGAPQRRKRNRAAGEVVCRNRGARVEQLESHVWRSVCELLQDPARIMQEWSQRGDRQQAGEEHDKQRNDALRVVRSHERTLQRLVDAYEAGAIELAVLTIRCERVRQRLKRARDEQAALEKVLTGERELRLVVARVEDFAHKLDKGLGELSWEQRRSVIRTVVARIEIDEDDVTVVYRVPAAGAASQNATRARRPPPPDTFDGCVEGVNTPR